MEVMGRGGVSRLAMQAWMVGHRIKVPKGF